MKNPTVINASDPIHFEVRINHLTHPVQAERRRQRWCPGRESYATTDTTNRCLSLLWWRECFQISEAQHPIFAKWAQDAKGDLPGRLADIASIGGCGFATPKSCDWWKRYSAIGRLNELLPLEWKTPLFSPLPDQTIAPRDYPAAHGYSCAAAAARSLSWSSG